MNLKLNNYPGGPCALGKELHGSVRGTGCDEGYPGRESQNRVVLGKILECKAGKGRIEVLSQKKKQPIQQVEGEQASSSRTSV